MAFITLSRVSIAVPGRVLSNSEIAARLAGLAQIVIGFQGKPIQK
jgi:hypothetical protein